jgi:motility quorum-sensing regulator/GCU-specific mRNA interferase toxin
LLFFQSLSKCRNPKASSGKKAGAGLSHLRSLASADFSKTPKPAHFACLADWLYLAECYNLAVEKKKPHYPLKLVKRLIADETRDPFTQSAKNGAAEMGLEAGELRGIVAGLAMRDFYKSMTTHDSSRVWQDVYRPVTRRGAAYVKVTINPAENLIVVSFKGL